jgi:hypothetical protein
MGIAVVHASRPTPPFVNSSAFRPGSHHREAPRAEGILSVGRPQQLLALGPGSPSATLDRLDCRPYHRHRANEEEYESRREAAASASLRAPRQPGATLPTSAALSFSDNATHLRWRSDASRSAHHRRSAVLPMPDVAANDQPPQTAPPSGPGSPRARTRKPSASDDHSLPRHAPNGAPRSSAKSPAPAATVSRNGMRLGPSHVTTSLGSPWILTLRSRPLAGLCARASTIREKERGPAPDRDRPPGHPDVRLVAVPEGVIVLTSSRRHPAQAGAVRGAVGQVPVVPMLVPPSAAETASAATRSCILAAVRMSNRSTAASLVHEHPPPRPPPRRLQPKPVTKVARGGVVGKS